MKPISRSAAASTMLRPSKTKAVRAGEEAPSAAPSARASRASRDSEASQAEPEAAPG